jgi:hypothetical protein
MIDAVGDAFSVDWAGFSSPNDLPISVESDWTVTSYTPTSVTLAVTITNTSDSSPASLTAVGFNASPDALSGTESSSIWEQVSVLDTSSFNFDVCVENDANNNCGGNSGNPAEGLAVNATDIFNLTLTFASTADGIVLSDFFARLQGIAPSDSAKLIADARCESGCEELLALTAVPEPATISLLGLGLAGAAARRCRKRR